MSYSEMVDTVKRPYQSPVREAQAAQTRERIALAAGVEFSNSGWTGTTVAAIARAAGVTPQAVHLAVGGKAALLVRAVEVAVAGAVDDVPLTRRPMLAAAYDENKTLEQRVAALAATAADVYRRAGRLFLVLQDAAASDPEVRELANAASARRLTDHRRLVNLLLPDLSNAQARALTDSIWVLAGPGVYVSLVHDRGWSASNYQQWLISRLLDTIRQARAEHGMRRRRTR
jgi:AcrR family transcriptional regulator